VSVTFHGFPRRVAAGIASNDVVPNGGCWVVHFGEKMVGMLEMARGYVEGEKLGDDEVLLREAVEKYLGVNLKEGAYAVAVLQ